MGNDFCGDFFNGTVKIWCKQYEILDETRLYWQSKLAVVVLWEERRGGSGGRGKGILMVHADWHLNATVYLERPKKQ